MPSCTDIESAPSADVELNTMLDSTVSLVVDKDDGKLKWTWWPAYVDRHATCIVRIHNTIPNDTAS